MERGKFIKGLLFGGVAAAVTAPSPKKEALGFDIIQEPTRNENGRIIKSFKFEIDPLFRKILEEKYKSK